MQLIFKNKRDIGGGATEFHFIPTEPVEWEAGQSIRLEVPGMAGTEERRFTISGPPSAREIVITTRPSDSGFKQALWHLTPGAAIGAQDIRGDFTWHNSIGDRVFVADNIGITPYYSMLSERVHKNEPLNASLFYTSAHQDAPYLAVLRQWQATHKELNFRHLPGQRPTPALVARYVPDIHNATVYIAGQSAIVDKMAHGLATEFKVPPQRIRRDWFTGRV